MEAAFCLPDHEQLQLFPKHLPSRIAMTHMRPEVFRGHLAPLFPDPLRTRVMGYSNRGGTLNEAGMLFANRSSWAHALMACAEIREQSPQTWLSTAELAAVEGWGAPTVVTAPSS
jgi:phosphoketolase